MDLPTKSNIFIIDFIVSKIAPVLNPAPKKWGFFLWNIWLVIWILLSLWKQLEMKYKLLQQIKEINLADYFYFVGQNSSVKILKQYLAESK